MTNVSSTARRKTIGRDGLVEIRIYHGIEPATRLG